MISKAIFHLVQQKIFELFNSNINNLYFHRGVFYATLVNNVAECSFVLDNKQINNISKINYFTKTDKKLVAIQRVNKIHVFE